MTVLTLIVHLPVRIIQSVIERLETWVKAAIQPRSDRLVMGTSLEMGRSKSELVAENALLRQQLIVVKRQNVLN